MNELIKHWSIDECIDIKLVKKKLGNLKYEGKIDYNITDEILHIDDIDLEEDEILEIIKIFDKNDIFPYPDYDDQIYDDEDYYNDDEDY